MIVFDAYRISFCLEKVYYMSVTFSIRLGGSSIMYTVYF